MLNFINLLDRTRLINKAHHVRELRTERTKESSGLSLSMTSLNIGKGVIIEGDQHMKGRHPGWVLSLYMWDLTNPGLHPFNS